MSDFLEKQIDFVGTKIILGFESILNSHGRAEARLQSSLNLCSRKVRS